jgi:PPK2 family polyphosphate:nucleotide phosphotransferase
MKPAELLSRFRIDRPERFRLVEYDCAETCGADMSKAEAKAALADDVARLMDLQERLYAHNRWALLLILQGMDASGKDSAIKHVMSGVNPQGCHVTSFKAPSAEELDHDFLWRHAVKLPERGRIGIFNRSYYEEVLVVRVHPELLARQRLPDAIASPRIWSKRFTDICAFERHLENNGTRVLKFFLNISKDEQRRRFLDRLDEPGKRWKFSSLDVAERKLWPRYMAAYQDMIRHTSTPHAPWYVVPADDKWFSRMIIASAMVQTLQSLHLRFPRVGKAQQAQMDRARRLLLAE